MKKIIQIAGIQSVEEALMVASQGVTHIGFPLHLAFHKEDMDAAAVRAVISVLPKCITPVLITYLYNAEKIISLASYIGVSAVQLHGRILQKEVAKLRKMEPHMYIIKSLVIGDRSSPDPKTQIVLYAPFVDAFLTDTFDISTGASGATGKVHDWNISKRIVDISPLPIILAGGLTPENVRSGIEFVRPQGVDAHTGVEDMHGAKDAALIERFVHEAMVGFLG
jgi:phosphoribosylanthranilate isomerase